MHSYTVYGLTVHSEFELPGLPPGSGTCDVRIVRAEISSVADGPATGRGDHASFLAPDGRGRIGGRIYDELKFFVVDGREIHIDATKELPLDVLRGYLTGVLFATLLRQRGLVVLHASCVAREGEAIAFLGDSGWGKSSIAEYLCQQGYTLINDDVLVVDLSDTAQATVLAGAPQLRLRPDAGRLLREDFDVLPPMHDGSAKRLNNVPQWDGRTVQLSRIFILEPRYRNEYRLRRISAREGLLELIRHSRASNLTLHPEIQAENLSRCADLVRRVPVAVLERTRGVESLGKAHALIEAVAADAPAE